MSSTVDPRLVGVPLRNAKATLRRGEAPVQKLKSGAGAVLEQARGIVGLEPKVMAGEMGISHSLVLRGLKSVDHLSFHRLWELSDEFWIELIFAIAKQRGMQHVAVKRSIEDRRTA